MTAAVGPIRVLVFTQSVARDRLLNGLLDHSDRETVRLSVVAMLRGPGPLLDDVAARGVAAQSLGLADGSLEDLPQAVLRLRSTICRDRPHLVHSLTFYTGLVLEVTRSALRGAPPRIVSTHMDHVADIEGLCRRQQAYAPGVVQAVRVHGSATQCQSMVDSAQPVRWGHDSLFSRLGKVAKAALSTRLGRLLVSAWVFFGERVCPDSRLLTRAYEVSATLALRRGVRAALSRSENTAGRRAP